ncbi:hypothetical protein KJ877_04520 [bacterium]|nr:hypothetical protein [bacterium]MBU1990340.1 hypothetical protein [bacterium]
MKLNTLPYYRYIDLLKRYRIFLLFIILVVVAICAVYVKNGFVYSDKSLWLKGSKEYSKLLALKHPSYNVEKVVIDISKDGWSEKAVSKLKVLQQQLMLKDDVVSLNTLFKQTSIFKNALSEDQSMIEITSLFDADDSVTYTSVLKNPQNFKNFVDGNQITFYIVSDGDISLSEFNCSYPYERSKVQGSTHTKDLLLFLVLFIILASSFTIAFKSVLPTLLGVLFIATTTLLTVALFQLISPVGVTHVSIVLLAVTVSVMDFVYIYYKWHVLQRSVSQKIILYRVFVKTVTPIFWTTFVSVVGIGSLVFVDSHILQSIGLNVLLSSLVGFVLSFTFLFVMLSFFRQKNPQIITKDSSKYFADKEAHYKKQWLNLFLAFSALVFVYGIFMYFYKPMNVVTDTSATKIQIALTQKGMNNDTLLELQNIQNLIQSKFENVDSFESAYTEIEKLYKQEHPDKKFNLADVDADAYSFMFDLYDITKDLMTRDHLTLSIYLKDTDRKTEILKYLRDEEILIQDNQSLLQIAKADSINTLFVVVFFVLFLIMAIIYYMTRTVQFMWIALIVNAIPLSWFFAAIMMLDIPLSTEMLVAMIITGALSSDATMHFIYYYYRNRLKPRSSEKVLENSFLYIGTPLGMGNIMLILTFISLIFVPDTTVSNIGIYSSMLTILSLFMDLFVLPVLFLNQIKSNVSIKGYYHGK